MVTISNPGSIPTRINPPRSSTLLPDPGIPKSNVGIRAPPSLALFADSGAITPRISPLPNREVSLLVCLRWLYAIQSTTVPPSPGNAPTTQPSVEHRSTSHQFLKTSPIPVSQPLSIRSDFAIAPLLSNKPTISGIANKPKPTITSGIPSIR